MKTHTKGLQFIRVRTEERTPLYVAIWNASYDKSMDILAERGMRPLTEKEANLHKYELSMGELIGRWAYLSGESPKAYFLDDDKATFSMVPRIDLAPLPTVRAPAIIGIAIGSGTVDALKAGIKR